MRTDGPERGTEGRPDAAALSALIDVLEDLIKVHDALIAAAERKRASLTAGEVPALEQAVAEEMALVRLAEQLEARRAEAVGRWAAATGRGNAAPRTLQDLIERLAPGEARTRLEGVRAALRDRIARLRAANEINQALIAFSLSSIEALIKLYAGAGEGAGYAPPGREVPRDGGALFDGRA
ncbi:MAG: hypothetical protein HSCHL_1718 [Hydrogenibacillus schlegelii]|uniref:Flagellar biosynthesis protein FlgN n=1 Tax=Hydrogenibacillus schlegelii TaxID=1484 RepID=A0A2T5GBI0_HYDSH|nr:flagellar protein FlgN [Hydrogenibacillus schlegelii]PTQ53541.1 MAG: hypothetical protein HSCHL_1718 [Hydrogenibacillus schlegelii]